MEKELFLKVPPFAEQREGRVGLHISSTLDRENKFWLPQLKTLMNVKNNAIIRKNVTNHAAKSKRTRVAILIVCQLLRILCQDPYTKGFPISHIILIMGAKTSLYVGKMVRSRIPAIIEHINDKSAVILNMAMFLILLGKTRISIFCSL